MKLIKNTLFFVVITLFYTCYFHAANIFQKEWWQEAGETIKSTTENIKSYVKTGAEATKTVIGELGYDSFKKHIEKHGLKNHFQPVSNELNFANYHFVGTHNSFSNKKVFKLYNQHWTTIEQQLAYGVRGFMLDTHWHENKVQLCHGSCTGAAALQTGSRNPTYETLEEYLKKFVSFLEKHTTEILYVNLENYVSLDNIQQVIKNIPKLSNYLFKQTDWNVDEKNQEWPTIGWMRKNNKRIIIVTSNRNVSKSKYPELWSTFRYSFENKYSTINAKELCQQRDESAIYNRSRKIVVFNCFREITGSVSEAILCNSYDHLKDILNLCRKVGFANNQTPNSFFTDHTVAASIALVKKGKKTIFDVVNNMNAQETVRILQKNKYQDAQKKDTVVR